MKFAGVPVPDISEDGGADQDQDGGQGQYAFHRRGSFRLGMGDFFIYRFGFRFYLLLALLNTNGFVRRAIA